MPYEFHLRHYDRAGALKRAILAPLHARFTESVHGQQPLVFTLDAADPAIFDVAELDIFEAMMRNRALGLMEFTRVFVGIQRHSQRMVDDDGLEIVEFTAPNEKHILSWRHVLWYAGVANRSDFVTVEAETIMKTVVDYNFTALATHTPADPQTRQRNGDMVPGMGITITTAPDLAGGNVLSSAFSGANALTILQKLAEKAGGDFSFQWQGDGTAEWVFEFHPGQVGADKSTGADRVLFSLDNNTMLQPRLQRLGAAATTAISAGKNEGIARDVTPVDGPDFAADYDLETFVDARNENTAEGREFRGGLRLEELRTRESLSFDVLQTANQFYSPVPVTGRKTYRAGDLVLAVFGGEQVRKIEEVIVNWKAPERDDAFQVSIVTREIPSA